jgi:hypothetical protein
MYQKASGHVLCEYDVEQARGTSASGECGRPWHTVAAIPEQQHLRLVCSPEAREPTLLRTCHM